MRLCGDLAAWSARGLARKFMTNGTPESQYLIAGGGIGGLTSAIALARQDLKVTVLERSDFRDESGAGIQLGPNATRLLERLGLLEAIEQVAFRPSAIFIFDGLSGRRLAEIPLGTYAEARYGAPYLTLHRADLHAVLHAACEVSETVALSPRFDLTGVEETKTRVNAIAADGRVAEAPALIGADGIWSEIRRLIAPQARLLFTGATAWRTLLPRGELKHPFDAPVVSVWLGPNTHLVHYPVRGGKELNVVAVTEGGSDTRGWNQTGDAEALQSAFADWCKEFKSVARKGAELAVLVALSAERLAVMDERKDHASGRCRPSRSSLSRARSGARHRGRCDAREVSQGVQGGRLDRLSTLRGGAQTARYARGRALRAKR